MKERPILFSGPMVRAILSDTKTQTRRVVKLPLKDPDFGCELAGNEIGETEANRLCPYGAPGDRLWVRETHEFFLSGTPPTLSVLYKADGTENSKFHASYVPPLNKGRPSIYMPRWASRITLEVTGVRVERVQEISSTDAEAEGVVCHPMSAKGFIDYYRELWDSINRKRAPWASNPWVWVVEFKRAI